MLRESHVIPAFAMRWLKESSTGGIRGRAQPNQRVQDGPKGRYLCDDCEQRVGKWETIFSQRIFAPLHDETQKPPVTYPYQAWFLKFAVSLSWRVLLHNGEKHGFDNLAPRVRGAVTEALEAWRLFLLDKRVHPGAFQQHLLPLGLISTAAHPISSPFFNRYLIRTVDHDLPHTDESLMVYTKIGKFAFFGFVLNGRNEQWVGTRLRVRNGAFNPSGTFGVPTSIVEFLNSKADDAAAGLASMSERQKMKVQQVLSKRPPSPESFRAFERDVALFGPAARFITRPLATDLNKSSVPSPAPTLPEPKD